MTIPPLTFVEDGALKLEKLKGLLCGTKSCTMVTAFEIPLGLGPWDNSISGFSLDPALYLLVGE